MPVSQIINEGKVPVRVYTDDIEASAWQQLVNLSQLPIIRQIQPSAISFQPSTGKELQVGCSSNADS